MPWNVLPNQSEILAIHVALLGNGKLLIFPGDQHRGSATDFQHARLFNPITNLIEPSADPPTTDVFCSGHAFLADGRLAVGGGTLSYGAAGHAHGGGASPFAGERSTWLYEPRAARWIRAADMNTRPGASNGGGRWYPTLVTLGNGEVLALSGHPQSEDPRHNNDRPERYSPWSNHWTTLGTRVWTGTVSGEGFYPRAHLLRDGTVFIAMHIDGSSKRMLDPFGDQLVGPDIADTGNYQYDNLWDGPSVLLPLLPGEDYRPRVLMACYEPRLIDLGAANPAWSTTAARVAGIPNRTYACGVILPTAEVFICGGVSDVGGDVGVQRGEFYVPGIDWAAGVYSPSGGPGPQPQWTATPDSATVVRNYHSVAILLADGRVWLGGSSKRAAAGDPTLASIAEKRIEIYSPDYVGQPRPTIAVAPDHLNYGAEFEIETGSAAEAASIQRVALIRCGSVTHAFDSDQRYVGLNFERIGAGNRLRAVAPPHGNVAPPGQYMLWIVDGSGRPCLQAKILRLAHAGSFLFTDRSSFSIHEVDAVLSGAGGGVAVFPQALYFAVEGQLPHEIAAIGGAPALTLHFDTPSGPAVPMAQMDWAPNGPALWEDPAQPPDRAQRVTHAFDIRFPSNAAFAGIDQRQVWVEARWGAHRAVARLDLTHQPNPYMLDGPTYWLSTDLRVYRIRRGESKFGATWMAGESPHAFVQRIQAFYNTPAGRPFFDAIPERQELSPLTLFGTEGGTEVINVAFARVRYRALSAQAPNVGVFFRMFNSVGTAIEYDSAGTYARHETATDAVPLLGRQGTTLISIPFFASPRVTPGGDMTLQPDPTNVHTLEPAGAAEFLWHYGAYLDINRESEPHFPATGGGNGPFGGDAQSIKSLLADLHQCLVAEVYFKPSDPMAPPLIVDRATPGSSDKLSQRNLAFVNSANPGVAMTRTVQHSFEIKASEGRPPLAAPIAGTPAGGAGAAAGFLRGQSAPDELLFVWGSLPRDSLAEIHLPAVAADDILALLALRPGPGVFEKVDAHTVRCRLGDVAYLPIPHGTVNHAGLISIELPAGVKHGQRFAMVAHQISGRTRRIIGAFELQVIVKHQHLLLDDERRRLSLLRWLYLQKRPDDRWRPVLERLIGAVAERVDGFGGDSSAVLPSPHEDGRPETVRGSTRCCWALPLLVAMLVPLLAVLPGAALAPVGAGATVGLIALWLWQRRCCPGSACQRLRGLLFGLIVGTAFAAIAAALGAAQAWPVLALSAVLSAAVAAVAVLRRCLGICEEHCEPDRHASLPPTPPMPQARPAPAVERPHRQTPQHDEGRHRH